MTQGSETRTSLQGSLEDLSLGEILQIVSLSQRSGVLRLKGAEGVEAHIFILAGKIIHATLSSDTEGLFAFLLKRRLVDPTRLEGARDRLREGMEAAELSALLAELGVPPVSFQQGLKRRVEEIVYSLFYWDEGSFSFELVDQKSGGAPFAANAFFLNEGINPQFLVMEGARRKDEANRDSAAGAVSAAIGEAGGSAEEGATGAFEGLLGGGRAGEGAADRLAREIDAFTPPSTPPRLPGRTSRVAIVVLESPHLRARIKESLEREKITVLSFPDGATALTGVCDLRTRDIHPLLVLDLRTMGIADGVVLGGLEVLTTLWDLGYNLPAVLVADGDVPAGLPARVESIPGVALVDARAGGEAALMGKVLAAFSPAGSRSVPASEGRDAGGKEEFYDIRAALSRDLAEVDLPMDRWQEEGPPAVSSPDDPMMEKLHSYMGELSRPEAGGEITLLALRFASECTGRALLFLARKTDLKGLGQFGVDLGTGRDSNRAIQSLSIPLTEDSVFTRVIRSYQSFRGAPTGSPEEKAIFAAMGGTVPHEIYVGPVVSMGKVAVILYGDDSPEGAGLPSTHALDVFLSHVGLALDRAFLEMKLNARRSS
jgi:hypothetical protein